ncbi:MAG: hypothetical protein ACREBS_03995 [Nitrososphaerales archaeon]
MDLRDAWKLSGAAYREVAYRSIQMSRGQAQGYASTSSEQDSRKRFNSAAGSAKISKVAFAVLGTIGSAFPFLEYAVAPTPEALISGVSLSLAISLAYIVFYSLQILPSFSSGEPYSILLTLPISEREFSWVATLSLVRTFDYIAASATIVQVVAVWILTHSISATVVMLIGAIINIVFAMAIALWFSNLFYKNLSSGRRSIGATIGRSLFLIGWGIAALSIGFIFNFISYLLPYLTGAVLGIFTQPSGLLLLVLHPFSIGFAIANIVYPSLYASVPLPTRTTLLIPRFVPPLLAYAASLGYVALSFILGRRTVRSVYKITRGFGVKISGQVAKDFMLTLRSPLAAYVVKDLRLASANPSLAFLYAAPLFEVITLAVITVQFTVMTATAMIVSTMVGCFFTTMICSTLLNTEGSGLEYSMSLPLSARTIIDAKALVATLTFFPVPLALLAIGLSKHVASYYILLIPFMEVIAISAASAGEIGFFLRPRGGKQGLRQSHGFSVMAGSDIGRLVESLIIAFVILLIPLGTFSVAFVQSSGYSVSVFAMMAAATAELFLVLGLNRRSTR